MLKKTRVIVSILFFSLITFFFLDFRSVLPVQFHVLAELQLIPALLKLNIIALAIIVLLTLLFGRIYCSSICPMGVFQDIAGCLSKRFVKKKKYTYSPAKNILRWSVLGIVFIAWLLGFSILLGLVDPYSAYGRIVSNLFRPLYLMGNNILESIFTGFGNYTFYRMDVFIYGTLAFIISLLTFLIIGILAWKYGRTYCNTICPVGTILGFLSKFSLFKVRIDESKCNSCGLCAMKCKASCIDSKEHTVDHSRCVDCFNCLQSCKHGALSFSRQNNMQKTATSTSPEMSTDNADSSAFNSRRSFLTTTATSLAFVPAAIAQDKVPNLTGMGPQKRNTPISPPGAKSEKNLSRYCTACHLCISKCPANILKPSVTEYGLSGIMQPVMYFEKGFCNYDCVICSSVCPSGALKPLTVEEKHRTQVGQAIFKRGRCIVITENTSCGACSEHCPTQAVSMKPYGDDGLTLPEVNAEICVGCGGCEYVCPTYPRAIYVEGNEVHLEAKPFDDDNNKTDIVIDGFGF